MIARAAAIAALALLGGVACAGASRVLPRPFRSDPSLRLARAESLFADLREAMDARDIVVARGSAWSEQGIAADSLDALARARLAATRTALGALSASDARRLAPDDRRALAAMRAALARLEAAPATDAVGCNDAAPSDTGTHARVQLSAWLYDCFGRAARTIVTGGDTVDRLTILSRLGREHDPAARKRLFLALEPVWRSVNGDGTTASHYRRLLKLSAREWLERGAPPLEGARALGIPPDSVEPWLVRVLERWRDAQPDSLREPWDWWYAAGRASRALSPALPLLQLRLVNEAYHRSLGADPEGLGVRYDLGPRDGKTPVAFTTFGRRARRDREGWRPTEPWVFATYRTGGLDNLNELLHETGHAIHIAAVRTRPAFLDWPDSDPLSEALGDLLALEAYEPAWQRRWLGDSVPTADALRARHAPVMLDVAWALLELRLHADPARDPNAEWTRITRDYLRVAPHPELSWWAMRGQLVDAPGYMANYAIGAILIADLRARMRSGRGPLTGDDPGWYAWASERLYRFGLESGSRETVERFLGRPVSPAALLADLDRLRASATR